MAKFKLKPEVADLISRVVPQPILKDTIALLERTMAKVDRAGQTAFYHSFSSGLRNGSLLMRADDFELAKEVAYNPNAWNNFPEVYPPQEVRMRVEFSYKNRPEKTYRACAYFFSGKWHWDINRSTIDASMVNVRFRPWD